MAKIGHCLLMFFVVALCVGAYRTDAEECPAGMQKRGDICCKTKTCKKNQDYRLCNDTHREDTCIPCPPNTINQDIIDTSRVNVQYPGICKKVNCCAEVVCLPEATLNRNECLKTGIPNCVCHLSIGFCGEDPTTCEKSNISVANLPKGIGLTQSCVAEKCKPGYFKDQDGYGPCIEHKECAIGEKIIFKGNSTMDRQCGPLTQTTTPTESTKMFDANSTVKNSSTPTSPSSDGTADPDQIIIGAVVGCIILIGVIVVFVAIIYRRRIGMNNENHGDEEQNGAERLSPNGREMDPPLQNGQEGSEHLTGEQGMVDTEC